MKFIRRGVHHDARAGVVHIYQVEDLREHCVSGWPEVRCWCNPAVEDSADGDGEIVIHNSMDGRESYEAGRRTH